MYIRQEYRETTVIRRSRFLACVSRADSEAAARAYIDAIRKEFPDSSHVCTAYVIGPHQEIQRSSDNQEPAGTAGVPILQSILKSGLTNVCVCVVRWFGGIKLGAGGLIRAYGGCAAQVLAHAPKSVVKEYRRYRVVYDYSLTGVLETWLRRHTEAVDFSYGEQTVCLFDSDDPDIIRKIRDLTSGRVLPEYQETVYREIAV